jgi:hypothetical protein
MDRSWNTRSLRDRGDGSGGIVEVVIGPYVTLLPN